MTAITDPCERIVAGALDAAGIAWTNDPHQARELDFYLPGLRLWIEVKQMHSPRIAEQMARAPDVIAIQGRAAAEAFARLIGRAP